MTASFGTRYQGFELERTRLFANLEDGGVAGQYFNLKFRSPEIGNIST
jgi:hypothetical protein